MYLDGHDGQPWNSTGLLLRACSELAPPWISWTPFQGKIQGKDELERSLLQLVSEQQPVLTSPSSATHSTLSPTTAWHPKDLENSSLLVSASEKSFTS